MSSDTDNEPTLGEVLAELKGLRKQISLSDKKALTFEDVGLLMGVHETTVRRMATLARFPQMREYQTDKKGNTVKRFVASEIHAYIERKVSLAS